MILPTKDEALSEFEKIIELLRVLDKGVYPELELEWLCKTAYNNGVYYTHVLSLMKAEKWLSTAIKLLSFFVTKVNYEAEIMASYTYVLSKLSNDNSDTKVVIDTPMHQEFGDYGKIE